MVFKCFFDYRIPGVDRFIDEFIENRYLSVFGMAYIVPRRGSDYDSPDVLFDGRKSYNLFDVLEVLFNKLHHLPFVEVTLNVIESKDEINDEP